MYEGTKENSVVYHNTNSPGALNVKADVKTREHDFRCEHRMSREPPGYYFGKRVLLPECSCRWLSSDVLSARTPPRGCINRDAGFSFWGQEDYVLHGTTTGASRTK